MFKSFGMVGLIGATALALSSSIASASVLNYLTESGNDCSGFYGQGFDACNISYDGGTIDVTQVPNDGLSPVIAKWDSADWTSDQGTFVDNGDETDINSLFDSSVNGSEFTIVENLDNNGDPDGTWTWTYNPGTDDPVIKYWAHKQSNGFTLYWETENACAVMDSLSCLQQAVAIETGTWTADGTDGWSHISWYDTDPDDGQGSNPTPVPLPAAGFLFLTALGGLGFFRRFRRVTG